jgi:magnesium-transporting ATPase (P-type)
VYTGIETRIILNSEAGKIKRSNLDRHLNKFFIYIFLFQILCCLVVSLMATYYVTDQAKKHHYLIWKDENVSLVLEGIYSFFRFWNLLVSLIPISLIVSLESVKLVQSIYIMGDAGMITDEEDKPYRNAHVAQTNIVEELGQVSYVFTDKTGTLTCNEMTFRAMCIGEIESNQLAEHQDALVFGGIETSLNQSTVAHKDRRISATFSQPAERIHSAEDQLHMTDQVPRNNKYEDETSTDAFKDFSKKCGDLPCDRHIVSYP